MENSFRPQLDKAKLRKYGQYELSKLSYTDIASVGGKHIGSNVEINCRLRLDESRWGVLWNGTEKRPAGIIRMDLSFKQTKGYKLAWASVKVTLDGEHEGLKIHRDGKIKDKDNVVILTGSYGPHVLSGEPIPVSQDQTFEANPNVTFSGATVSALSFNHKRSYVSNASWDFRGFPETRPSDGTFDSVEWHLLENHFERQPSYPTEFKTAFAFTNNGQPFLMKVEIDGRLSRITQRLKKSIRGATEIFKFGSGGRKDENISTTLVRGFSGKLQHLDEFTKHLEREMMVKNGRTIDPKPATVPTPSSEESQAAQKTSTDSEARSTEGEDARKTSTDAGAGSKGYVQVNKEIKDMVQTHFIPPREEHSHCNGETKENSSTAVTEMGSNVEQVEIDLKTARTFFEKLLLSLRQGWLWFFYHFYYLFRPKKL